MLHKQASRLRRKARIRAKISGSAVTPRLSVFRSGNHIYAQLIDDVNSKTLGSASDLKNTDKATNVEKAAKV